MNDPMHTMLDILFERIQEADDHDAELGTYLDDVGVAKAHSEMIALRETVEALRAALVAAKRSHHRDDSPWHSCPKTQNNWDERRDGPRNCNCGAAEHNAAIEAALDAARKALGE